MQRSVYVPAIGQYDNIGDILLRRPLLDWLRPHGTLHVFVGRAPAGYIVSLNLDPEDVVYTSFLDWYWNATRDAWRGRADYAFKPGEIQMSLRGLKEHVVVLPLLTILKARGGHVVRVGSGARNFARWLIPLVLPSVRQADLLYWRDAETARYFGLGAVMPDLAFSGGDATPASDATRRYLTVSMRGDRDDVPDTWVHAVRELADSEGMDICVVTQVARDAERSRSLARRLDAILLDWSGEDHVAQEKRLIDVYRSSRMVLSDRLHVLIAGATYGAHPTALLTDSSKKVSRHFEAVGVSGVGQRFDPDLEPRATADALRKALASAPAVRQRLAVARQDLERLRRELDQCLGKDKR